MKFVLITRKQIFRLLLCAAACTAVLALGARGAVVSSEASSRIIPVYNVKTEEKKIAISFDAAWGNEDTQNLIDILDRYHVKATFFVVGDWVKKYPQSVDALIKAGHEIGNHSDTHPHMPKLSREEMMTQLRACSDKIEKATGLRPVLYRPPYGDYDNASLEVAKEQKLYAIQWDVDSLDWKNPPPGQIVERVVSQVRPGSIMLFHNGAINTPTALPEILERLQRDGYTIVPVSQLIYKENYTIDHTGMQIPDN